MPSAIRTTFVICCVPLDLLSRPLSFFINMANAVKNTSVESDVASARRKGRFDPCDSSQNLLSWLLMILTNAIETTLVDAP